MQIRHKDATGVLVSFLLMWFSWRDVCVRLVLLCVSGAEYSFTPGRGRAASPLSSVRIVARAV